MILVVDNFDSFVYTIVGYLRELGADVVVRRNDVVTDDEVDAAAGILISPGPGTPAEAGRTLDVIGRAADRRIPLLGVCLGHQAIGEAFGASVAPAPELMHGKISVINHDGTGIFAGLPSPLEVTRYHSLAIVPETMPGELTATATVRTVDGSSDVIMAIEHTNLPMTGVQFHPEAYLTQHGKDMLATWLASLGEGPAARASAEPKLASVRSQLEGNP